MHILDRLKAYLFAKNESCIFEPGATINFQSRHYNCTNWIKILAPHGLKATSALWIKGQVWNLDDWKTQYKNEIIISKGGGKRD